MRQTNSILQLLTRTRYLILVSMFMIMLFCIKTFTINEMS